MSHSNLVQSVQRALILLQRAAESEYGLTLGEAATLLGVSKPTAFNLIRTLVHEGFLEKIENPIRYVPGPTIQYLMNLQVKKSWLIRAEEMMREIYHEVPVATIVVCEWVNGDILIRLRMDPAHPGKLERHVNRSLPPYTSASGICFFTFLSEPERSLFQQRYPFEEYGVYAWQNEVNLEQFCHNVRQRGIVELIGSSSPYRAAIPLWDSHGRLTGCLGASLKAGYEQWQDKLSSKLVSFLP